jgi:hypothetical protein
VNSATRKNIPSENITYGDKMPNSSKLTTVRSIRASNELWVKVKELAEKDNTKINTIVIRAVIEYIIRQELANGRPKH